MSETKCENACTFDYEEHAFELAQVILQAAETFAERRDFDICPICLREELLAAAAALHLGALKHNAKQTGELVSADQIYKLFTEVAYREMYKLVDLEIEQGGMTGLYKQ